MKKPASVALSLLLGMSLLLAGCFQVNAKLNSFGGALIALNYPLPKGSTIEKERSKFESASTSVKSAKLVGKRVQVVMTCKDITKISAASAFKHVSVERSKAEQGRQKLSVTITNAKPRQVESKAVATIKLTLPGPVIETTAERAGPSQVAWKIPVTDYAGKSELKMSVTYGIEQQKPSKAPGASPTPAGSPRA